MNLAELSIRRPIFISCVVILMLAVGLISFGRLGVDLFPDVTFPVVTVSTPYPGAGPKEIETQVSKIVEDELSTISGVKTVRSINQEGISIVVTEFTLETDVQFAEQQVRDRVSSVKRKLPNDVQESVIRRIDPADQPIMVLSFSADLPPEKMFDLADETIRPRIEQVNQVGLVEILGGRKREIRVELDQNRLKNYEVSANTVSSRIAGAGQNIPAGKVDEAKTENIIRTVGEFKNLKEIEDTIINFAGNDVAVRLKDLGTVRDGLRDEKSRTFSNGLPAVFLYVYRQSGANTIAVTDSVRKRVASLNQEIAKLLKAEPNTQYVTIASDRSKFIRLNVDDVRESILIGIALTILVVYFFLGSFRSTIITGLALPNSLIGAFILMLLAGFTINIMTLLALSLAVGLLVDDAIVVRENIFRHIEMGKSPSKASIEGTAEVGLAVVATTLTVIAVFGPIGFLDGVVGQFFKEFGLTICFAMMISLFDALTIAPMLSAYFAGGAQDLHAPTNNPLRKAVQGFDRFQTYLENGYVRLIRGVIKHPLKTLGFALLIFVGSIFVTRYIPKTFLPANDAGEFSVGLDLPPGTSLSAMADVAQKVDAKVRENKEVATTLLTVGNKDGAANVADIFVQLVPAKERKGLNTTVVKDKIREQMEPFVSANPIVKDNDMVGGGMRPFTMNISGPDLDVLETYSTEVYKWLRKHPGLKDVDISFRPGKPEFQIEVDQTKAKVLGISTSLLGLELRTLVEGATPAIYRENGREYDVRVRLMEEQRDLKKRFDSTYVPNINMSLVKLSGVAKGTQTTGPATINRQDRQRYIAVMGDITPGGVGIGGVMQDIEKAFRTGELKLPEGVNYRFVGQAENFQELIVNMLMAAALGILFIYLVLSSLYESFVTPFTIMLVLPLAMCGAFYALWITRASLDLFSMIGCIMLLGVATKNSILLVDYTVQKMDEGVDRDEAIIAAGKTRLRPILMTTVALIAGMLPLAIGLNEASKQRTSMGIAVIGGLISSTLLTLIVVPAAYSYVDRFRLLTNRIFQKISSAKAVNKELAENSDLSH